MLRRALPLFVFLGASPARAEEPPAGLRADLGELRVARVLAYGAGTVGRANKPLVMAEPPEPIAADSLVAMPALGDGETSVPLLLASADLRLIVSVPAKLLATVALDDAFVYADKKDAAGKDAGRARLRPGVSPELQPAGGDGWRAARFNTSDLEIAGVVRADRVGHAYHDTSGYLDGGDAELRGDAKLLGSPGGAVLATLHALEPWRSARVLGAAVRGHVRVKLTESDVQVEGWVPADQVRKVPESGTGGSWASGHGSGFTGRRPGPRIRLAKGTLLRVAPGGEIVGVIMKDSEQEQVKADPPTIVVHTRFGDAELVAAP